jgi:hypothetical protein
VQIEGVRGLIPPAGSAVQHIITAIFLHRDLLGAIPSRKHALLVLFHPFVADGRSAEHGV